MMRIIKGLCSKITLMIVNLIPIILFNFYSCTYDSKDEKYFVEVGAEVGIDFVHHSGSKGDYFLFETNWLTIFP